MRETSGEPGRRKAVLRICIEDMIALRVRAADSNTPDLLYQSLPSGDMALLATIPEEVAAVSIPRQNDRYPISPAPPNNERGIVIVYKRMPNNRYEAIEVLLGGESLSIADSQKLGSRWALENAARLQKLPGKYAYFSPDRDQWGVILRDGGFTVYDPSMESDLTPAILGKMLQAPSSGLIARIPLPAGHQPVFARVHVAAEPHPTPASAWVEFIEWQRLRSIQSRPPEAVIPAFEGWLRALARESGFASWSFRKGMFFGDHAEWWGACNRRRTPHEGIDLAEGTTAGGQVRNIPEGTPVRSILGGELSAVLEDFLNKTLVLRHPGIRDDKGGIFHTFFSHIEPGCFAPTQVVEGQLLGKVLKAKNTGASPHLHVTGAWVPESLGAGSITMDRINPAYAPVVLVNFNSLLSGSR